MPALITLARFAELADETFCRVANALGGRDYYTAPNTSSAPLCDEQGRLLVRAVGPGGYPSPSPAPSAGATNYLTGSAPQESNVGLVESHRVLEAPTNLLINPGNPYVSRMFGYVAAAGWVQLILKDETGGVANPPALGDVPEVSIAVGAATNFVFGDWLLMNNAQNLATYIAFSTTGAAFTPGGANMWFSYYGSL